MNLKELRLSKKITQKKAAELLNISLRTYQYYESNIEKQKGPYYQYMYQKLNEYGYIDEEHGILSFDTIKEVCTKILKERDVNFCYLFGSYAKKKAKENSDVDLLISTDITGLAYFDLVEELRENLKKKVDLLNVDQLLKNKELINEIMKDGIKIYG